MVPTGYGPYNLCYFALGATYLQSTQAESECVAFFSSQLCRENVFRIHKFAAEVAASAAMCHAAKAFIQQSFSPVLALFKDSLSGGDSEDAESPMAEFLAATAEMWRRLLSQNLQIGEQLLFYALLGWLEHDVDTRQVLQIIFSGFFWYIYWGMFLPREFTT